MSAASPAGATRTLDLGPSPRRTVVFVGAFDPMHRAHVQKAATAARLVRGTCLVMPIAHIPHKPDVADIGIRLEIIRAQIASLPDVQVVEETPGLHSENYMFELAAGHGDRVFSLLGRDSFNAIDALSCAADIVNHTTTIVAARDGYVLDDVASVTHGLARFDPVGHTDPILDLAASGVEVLGTWRNAAPPHHQIVHAVLGDLSRSSQHLRTTSIAAGADLAEHVADATAAALIRLHYGPPGVST